MRNYLQTNHNNYNDLFDMFDDFFKPVFFEESKELHTDIQETEKGYELDLEMPGYAKDQISITLDNGYLTVSAKREAKKEEGKRFVRREIAESRQRTFYVGTNVAQEDIKAKFDNGMLSLTIPKDKPKQVTASSITID